MESLRETHWDVIISGTGLSQSLLALALSRSGKHILHVDKHSYYGGDYAAFTLSEAESWMREVNAGQSTQFSDVQIIQPELSTSEFSSTLRQPRSYALSLSPQFIYAKSKFLQNLISSRIQDQLEFLAVGSWWVLENGHLKKIPSGREDVFADESLSMRDKRGLMKFLRYILQETTEEESTGIAEDDSLSSVLSEKFNLSQPLHLPVLALSLSMLSASLTRSSQALARIKLHLLSIGTFGPGFGAIIPKFGGNAEICQAGCRAGAVGGGVYILGQGITGLEVLPGEEPKGQTSPAEDLGLEVEFSGGEKLRSSYVVGTFDDLPDQYFRDTISKLPNRIQFAHSISIVSRALPHIFPPISENGPLPAAALILVPGKENDAAPMYLQVHADETGECPSGQCIIYGSTIFVDESSRAGLETAVQNLLTSGAGDDPPTVLWSISYLSKSRTIDSVADQPIVSDLSNRVFAFNQQKRDIALDDDVLTSVKAVWKTLLGDQAAEETFMLFEDRETGEDF